MSERRDDLVRRWRATGGRARKLRGLYAGSFKGIRVTTQGTATGGDESFDARVHPTTKRTYYWDVFIEGGEYGTQPILFGRRSDKRLSRRR